MDKTLGIGLAGLGFGKQALAINADPDSALVVRGIYVRHSAAAEAVQAGADTLVAGSAIFKGGTEASYRDNIAAIRRAVASVRGEMV